jgi:2-polyprenyl-3-methyl-5-hydroxy-6-metoxy-1,4-benzoquinol methylase
MKINKCRNCNNKELLKLFSLGNLAFTGKFSKLKNIKKAQLRLSICKNCKLVQLTDSYNLKYLYGADYGYRTGLNQTMTKHVKNVVKFLEKKTLLCDGEAVLDIASNDGTLLNFYKKDNFRFGIDPILKKYIKYYKDINHKVADFFSLNKIKNVYHGKFKIITALSVFYDLEDPNKFLSEVEKLISDDGIILIEFADLYSILKYNMFDAICHEHLAYYTSKIIISMCKKNNLKIIDIKRNNVNGGSVQYYITKKDSKYLTSKRIEKILNSEKYYNLEKKETFTNFFLKIKKIKNELVALIKKVKLKNKKIHGYGASTKGNVLLQYFKLNNKHIEFIAERNPQKYNLYTPGTNIKIISENKSRSLKPDYYIVLPWHFKKEILRREKKTINNGSKFIFPLPSLEVYE